MGGREPLAVMMARHDLTLIPTQIRPIKPARHRNKPGASVRLLVQLLHHLPALPPPKVNHLQLLLLILHHAIIYSSLSRGHLVSHGVQLSVLLEGLDQ